MERPETPKVADEKSMLAGFLDYFRATVVLKTEGLTDEQARRSPVPSGTSLFGLVSHLVYVERWWFADVIGGLHPEYPYTEEQYEADPDLDFRAENFASLAEVVAEYEAECARSREVLAAADLDRVVEVDGRPARTVRWIVVHMVEETARHAGHADILRELADGTTGY